MNGSFFVVKYEMVAQEQGNVLVATLIKETDVQHSGIIGIKNDKKVGFAGTLEIHVYDPELQQYIADKLGEEIELELYV